jgi:hypothetical protein
MGPGAGMAQLIRVPQFVARRRSFCTLSWHPRSACLRFRPALRLVRSVQRSRGGRSLTAWGSLSNCLPGGVGRCAF